MRVLWGFILSIVSAVVAGVILANILGSKSEDLDISHYSFDLPLYRITEQIEKTSPKIIDAIKESYSEEKRDTFPLGIFSSLDVNIHQFKISNHSKQVADNIKFRVKHNILTFFVREDKSVSLFRDEKVDAKLPSIFPNETLTLYALNTIGYNKSNVTFLHDKEEIPVQNRYYSDTHPISWWMDFFVDDDTPLPSMIAVAMFLGAIGLLLILGLVILSSFNNDIAIKLSDASGLARSANLLKAVKDRDPQKFRQAIAASNFDDIAFHVRPVDAGKEKNETSS